VKRNDSMLEEN